MFGYKILNNLKPKFQRTKYPFSLVDKEKITTLKNDIEIIVKEAKQVKKNKPVKGGGFTTVYLY